MATVASEIARSNDVFIKHNFDNHDGEVPVWAAVEVPFVRYIVEDN